MEIPIVIFVCWLFEALKTGLRFFQIDFFYLFSSKYVIEEMVQTGVKF